MSTKEFLQDITNAQQSHELNIDAVDEFSQNRDIFWLSILELSNLTSLNIENQYIDDIPLEISKLSNLESLIIANFNSSEFGGLRNIPEGILHLPKLKRLELIGQRIEKIPRDIKT